MKRSQKGKTDCQVKQLFALWESSRVKPARKHIDEIDPWLAKSTSLGIVFNLGGDRTSKDPEEAADMFMERSFQQIVKFEDQPHDLIFAPDAYHYPSKFIQKVSETQTSHQRITICTKDRSFNLSKLLTVSFFL